MPPKCKECEQGRNCINGRYCLKLRAFVNYLKDIVCNEDYDSENGRDHHFSGDGAR